jgi:hypothetical protein
MACKIDFNNFFMKTFYTIQAHPFHLVEPSPWIITKKKYFFFSYNHILYFKANNYFSTNSDILSDLTQN